MAEKIKVLTYKNYLIAAAILAVLIFLVWYLQHAVFSIEVAPAYSTVLIDGNKASLSRAGKTVKFLPAGKHQISIEAEGYFGLSQNYTLKRGLLNQLKVTLKSISTPVKLSDGQFLSKGDDSSFYYLGDNGTKIYKAAIQPDSSKNTINISSIGLTENVLSGIKDLYWSPDKSLILVRKMNDEIHLFDFNKYDFIHQTETFWGKNIGMIAWSPDKSKIAYYYNPSGGERTLIFSNITNTEQTRILNFAELGIKDPLLRWSPDSQWLLIIPRNDDPSTNKIYSYNVYTGVFKPLTDFGNQIDAIFSPESDKIYYTTYSPQQGSQANATLSSMDLDGGNKKDLGVRAVLTKMSWSANDNMFEVGPKQILSLGYDVGSKNYKINFTDISTGLNNVITPENAAKLSYYSIILMMDDKLVLYQTDEGIYGFRIN